MQTIAIVDYGMGNVRSVQKALEYVAPNDHCLLTNDSQKINDSDRVVFPGQGAMGACMSALQENDLIEVIKIASKEKPFLGICLGLQLLFDRSEENNGTDGLSIIPGEVIKFKNNKLKIPHMGWNNVKEKDSSCVTGTTNYGENFTSAVAQDKLFAVQFHPEKSQSNGLQLLKNFINWD